MNMRPPRPPRGNGYPTTDGKPMAETDRHIQVITDTKESLRDFFAADPRVYVTGNILLLYEEGDRRKPVSPDVMVVRGVGSHERDNYLVWDEGRGPGVVVEVTSSSTRKEDTDTKLALYRDVLAVREYFLFDPKGDWLSPRLQGHRLRAGAYHPIRPRDGRLPSQVLKLHLEAVGDDLRLYDPAAGRWLPRRAETIQATREEARQARDEARTAAARAAAAEAEAERLRRELDRLRGGRPGGPG